MTKFITGNRSLSGRLGKGLAKPKEQLRYIYLFEGRNRNTSFAKGCYRKFVIAFAASPTSNRGTSVSSKKFSFTHYPGSNSFSSTRSQYLCEPAWTLSALQPFLLVIYPYGFAMLTSGLPLRRSFPLVILLGTPSRGTRSQLRRTSYIGFNGSRLQYRKLSV